MSASMLTQCVYLTASPPLERLCDRCPDFLNICTANRCTATGLVLGVECDLLMCEACEMDCIYNKFY